MQRRVPHPQVSEIACGQISRGEAGGGAGAGAGRSQRGRGRGHIGGVDLRAEADPAVTKGEGGGRSDGVDRSLDLAVDGSDDLCPVRRIVGRRAQVHLVAVVGRRIVTCGDHNAGVRAEPADGERQHRRGHRDRQQGRPHPRPGEHLDTVEGEPFTAMPGIRAHDNQRRREIAVR